MYNFQHYRAESSCKQLNAPSAAKQAEQVKIVFFWINPDPENLPAIST